MKIPFLDLKKVNAELDREIKSALQGVVESGWYILGKAGEAFEENLKKSLAGAREGYAVGCNSGTDALILSLLAIGAGPGDEVITVSHTAIPTICAINAVGAKPVFVDIDKDTWVMDTDMIQPAMTHKTKAIIPVHLYGNMVDVLKIKRSITQAGREDIHIIEDVAQAQGSQLGGSQAGTLGRFGAFSFYPSKNIGAIGDGGAIFCHSRADMQCLKSLRNYGQKDRYNAEAKRGLNSRLDELQAAILDIKLERLTGWNQRKAVLREQYRVDLSKVPVVFQKVTDKCKPAWHLCVIALEDKKTRDDLMTHLADKGIQTLIHYPIPAHCQKAFVSGPAEQLPVTENLANRVLSLPFNTALSGEDISQISGAVRSFFS
jgi:dTDP-3-amino-3,4,6-trideoxy-alpha-D-glucose transaminase